MPMIDLGSPSPAPVDLLDGLPRRVALTLPELRFVAERAGGAPLPFDVSAPRAGNPLLAAWARRATASRRRRTPPRSTRCTTPPPP